MICVSHLPGPGVQEGLVDLDLDLTHSIRDGEGAGGLLLEGEKQGAGYQTPLFGEALFSVSLFLHHYPHHSNLSRQKIKVRKHSTGGKAQNGKNTL